MAKIKILMCFVASICTISATSIFDDQKQDDRSKKYEHQNFLKRDENTGGFNKELLKRVDMNELYISQLLKGARLAPDTSLGGISPNSFYTKDQIPFIGIFKFYWAHCEAKYKSELNGWPPEKVFSSVEILAMLANWVGKDAIVNYEKYIADSTLNEAELQRKEHSNQIELDAKKKSLGLWLDFFGNLLGHLKNLLNPVALLKDYMAMLSLALIIIVYFLAKYGTPYLFKKIPKIVKETNLTWYGRKNHDKKGERLFYNENTEDKVEYVLDIDKRIIAHNASGEGEKLPLHSLLLVGPPGTGKTALAKKIALESDCDYMIIGGARWYQMDPDEALQNYYDMVNRAKRNSRTMVIFIDEVDVLFGHRQGGINDVGRLLTTAHLEMNETGINTNIKWIYATNRPQDLSSAFMNRVGETIEVCLPELETILSTFHYNKNVNSRKYRVQFNISNQDVCELFKGESQRTIKTVVARLARDAHLLHKRVIDLDDFEFMMNKKVQKKQVALQQKQQVAVPSPAKNLISGELSTEDYTTFLGIFILCLIALFGAISFFARKKKKKKFKTN